MLVVVGKRGGERRGREPLYLALLCLLLLLNFPAGAPADEINRLAVLALQVRRIGHFPGSLNASFGTARHCPHALRGRAGAAGGGLPDTTCSPPALTCPPASCPSPLRYGLPPESEVVRGRSARGKGVAVLGFLIYFYFIFYSGVCFPPLLGWLCHASGSFQVQGVAEGI